MKYHDASKVSEMMGDYGGLRTLRALGSGSTRL